MAIDFDPIGIPEEPEDPENPLGDTAEAWCPYCGEPCELVIDPGGGAHQEYVEDCPVCCRPWRVTATWYDGVASVRLDTEDE